MTILRRKPLKRSALKPRTTPLARRRKRKPSEFARVYHSRAFVAWIHAQPSVASGMGPCVAVHTDTGGMGRKAEWTSIVPLTDIEHLHLHHYGRSTFEQEWNIDLAECAENTARAWLAREAVA